MPRLTLILVFLFLCAAPEVANAEGRAGCTVDPTRRVDLPCEHLKLSAGIRLTEGPFGLEDAFPYLAAAPVTVSGRRAWKVTPKHLGSILHKAPQKGGSVPAAVRTAQGAIEAVRLFAAGPIVPTAEAGERILAAARRLKPKLELLRVDLHEHRPKTWAPVAKPLPQDRSLHPTEAWAVSLVALELDRSTRLVQIEGVVKANGTVTLRRHVMVEGPTHPQQWIFDESVSEAESKRRLAGWKTEETCGRRLHLEALAPKRTVHRAWAAARCAYTYADVVQVLGEADRDVGSGIHIRAYDLADGTAVLFGETGGELIYARQAESAPRVMRVGKVTRTFAVRATAR